MLTTQRIKGELHVGGNAGESASEILDRLYDYLAGGDNPSLAQSRLNARVNIVLREFHCTGYQLCLWAPNCWPEFQELWWNALHYALETVEQE